MKTSNDQNWIRECICWPQSLGSLSFAKLVMISSAPAKSAGGAIYMSQDPFIHGNQGWLQSV